MRALQFGHVFCRRFLVSNVWLQYAHSLRKRLPLAGCVPFGSGI